MSTPSMQRLRNEGLLASDAAVARVVERFGVPGSTDSARVWEATVAGGLGFDVLADRGFDIGSAEYGGFALSWRSPVADQRPLSRPVGDDWLDRFTGGLLVTCGLRAIGRTPGQPLHGDISHRPASAIRALHHRGTSLVELAADIEDESIFGPALRLERRITSGISDSGAAWLTVEDCVVNVGLQSAPLSMLYHLNFGAPLVVPGTEVLTDASSTRARDSTSGRFDPTLLAEPVDEVVEAVFAHDAATNVRIVSPLGLSVTIDWSTATLPHVHQWLMPTRGRWALAVEPATHQLFRDDPHSLDDSVVIAPGDRQNHRLHMTIEGSL